MLMLSIDAQFYNSSAVKYQKLTSMTAKHSDIQLLVTRELLSKFPKREVKIF